MALLCFAFSATGYAEWIPPEQTSATTPRYDNVFVNVPAGVYHYDISWQGIPVASSAITIEPLQENGKKELHVEAKVRTNGAISLLYSLRHTSEALFESAPFRPIRFASRQIENSNARYRTVDFQNPGKVRSKFWRPGKPAEEYDFDPKNFMLDPVSAALLAMSVPIEIGNVVPFDVFNGKHRFVITFTVQALEEVSVGREKVKAYRVEPKVQKLTDTEGEKRLTKATIWIAADDTRRILRLESKVFIGKVVAKLVKFEPPTVITPPDVVRGRLAEPDLHEPVEDD